MTSAEPTDQQTLYAGGRGLQLEGLTSSSSKDFESYDSAGDYGIHSFLKYNHAFIQLNGENTITFFRYWVLENSKKI